MRRGLHALAGALLAAVLVAAGCGGGGTGVGTGLAGNAMPIGAGAAGADGGGIGSTGGESVAGVGSGGTGISGEGVGSGGTGVSTADSGVGSVDGFGSIVVNGTRFDIANAQVVVADGVALKLGMTVRVIGSIEPDLRNGTAQVVFSAADLRGTVEAVATGAGTFTVLSVPVATDESTVYAGGLGSLADLRAGDAVQVHGLPGQGLQFRATRVERLPAPGTPILTGTVRALDTANRAFSIGSVRVSYAAAQASLVLANLVEGELVRVRARGDARPLDAAIVEPWYPVRPADGSRLALGGLVTQFSGLSSLQVDGVPVNAAGAAISGGPASALGLGARVEVAGTFRSGVLVATRLKLRDAAPPSTHSPYTARGSVGSFRSASDFKVRGQDIDAGRPGVVFVGGTAADLGNSRRVLVSGSRVVDDVLVAERVEFLPD